LVQRVFKSILLVEPHDPKDGDRNPLITDSLWLLFPMRIWIGVESNHWQPLCIDCPARRPLPPRTPLLVNS